MTQPKTLLEEKESLQVFKELLTAHFDTQEAIINLGKMPQWAGFRKALDRDVTPLCHARTLLINGYFYNFTSPVPTQEELNKAFHIGNTQQVDFFMVPTVREVEDTSILENNGFIKVPFHIESIFERENNVDLDIRCKLSGKSLKNIRAYDRKANDHYTFNLYQYEDCIQDSNILKDAAQLHSHNSYKYGHFFNLYDYETLNTLTHSNLKKSLLIVLRSKINQKLAVQTLINFFDVGRSHLYIMAQGKKDELIETGNNLYVASFYRLFKVAESLGIKEIHLGRGAYKDKRKIGANKFNILNNWIKARLASRVELIEALRLYANNLKLLQP